MDSEHRKYRRYPVPWYITVAHRKFGAVRVKTVDMGLSGLRFESEVRHYVNAIVESEIWVNETESFRCHLRIIRELRNDKQQLFMYGAQFIRFSEGGYYAFSRALLKHRNML